MAFLSGSTGVLSRPAHTLPELAGRDALELAEDVRMVCPFVAAPLLAVLAGRERVQVHVYSQHSVSVD